MPVMLEAVTNIDLALLHAIRDTCTMPVLDAVVPFVTSLGNLAFVWFVAAALLIRSKRYRPYGIAVVIAIAAAFLIGEVGIKNIVERPRPFLADPSLATEFIRLPSSFSFPSGHTGSSFAAAATLCFLPLKRGWIKAVPLCGAALVAFSRLYLCVHYPSDVLGGIVVGVACGIAAGLFAERFLVPRSERVCGPPRRMRDDASR